MNRQKNGKKSKGKGGQPSRGRSARNSRSRSGRSAGMSQTSRRDQFGRQYGGQIFSLALHRAQDFSPKPRGPVGDADYSTCQMINSLGIENGFIQGNSISLPACQATPTNNVSLVYAASLQDLPQVGSFQALFDQYRIDKIEMKFVPQSTEVNLMASASPNDTNPTLLAVLDFDDTSVLSNPAAAEEYDNCQAVQFGEGLFVRIWPTVATAVGTVSGGSVSNTGAGVARAGWLDLPAPGTGVVTPHFGFKGVITALQTSSTSMAVWTVMIKMFLSFRNTR